MHQGSQHWQTDCKTLAKININTTEEVLCKNIINRKYHFVPIYLMVIVLRQLVEGIFQPENVASEVLPAADALRHRRSRFGG